MKEDPKRNSRRAALRKATAQAHQDLDQTVGKLHPFETIENYRRYALVMGRLHWSFAPSIAFISQACQLPDPTPQILSAVQQDTSIEPQESILERQPSSPAEHWGAAYVLEGSAHGASYLIDREATPLLGEHDLHYISLIASFKETRWPRFVEELTQTQISTDDAIQSALLTFKKAHEQFAQELASKESVE